LPLAKWRSIVRVETPMASAKDVMPM